MAWVVGCTEGRQGSYADLSDYLRGFGVLRGRPSVVPVAHERRLPRGKEVHGLGLGVGDHGLWRGAAGDQPAHGIKRLQSLRGVQLHLAQILIEDPATCITQILHPVASQPLVGLGLPHEAITHGTILG